MGPHFAGGLEWVYEDSELGAPYEGTTGPYLGVRWYKLGVQTIWGLNQGPMILGNSHRDPA